tara:strand:- start:801 stop:1667 length:867 start_codon:yes stop_codon:yes gene_type:complete
MGNVKMRVWDVKHGNAIYIRTPNEKHIVIDLGVGDYSEEQEDRSPLETLANHYKIEKIDYLVITHPHKDHIKDILNLEKLNLGPRSFRRPRSFDISTLMDGVRSSDKQIFEKYIEINNYYNQPVSSERDTGNPDNYGGVSIKFFQNGTRDDKNLNNHSIITIIDYATIRVVIPGDNEYDSLEKFMQQQDFKEAIKDCDILIAPHHGRESAYHPGFVKYSNPRLTIVSDGSICETSANGKYSSATKRGWDVLDKGKWNKRYLLTTNYDGEVYIDFGFGKEKPFLQVEVK